MEMADEGVQQSFVFCACVLIYSYALCKICWPTIVATFASRDIGNTWLAAVRADHEWLISKSNDIVVKAGNAFSPWCQYISTFPKAAAKLGKDVCIQETLIHSDASTNIALVVEVSFHLVQRPYDHASCVHTQARHFAT